jgi:uncharacterized protein with HEPN domain
MSKRNVKLYLEDIDNAISSITAYSRDMSFTVFSGDRKTREAVILNFIILGEAIKKLPPAIIAEYPDIPWKEFAGMRDRLVHDYFQVDAEIVWETIRQDLPLLSTAIKDLLKKER